jgi:hypothetical protein
MAAACRQYYSATKGEERSLALEQGRISDQVELWIDAGYPDVMSEQLETSLTRLRQDRRRTAPKSFLTSLALSLSLQIPKARFEIVRRH